MKNNPKSLKIGDKIRFVAVPEEKMHKESIQFIKAMIGRKSPSRINRIDSSGYPWISAKIKKGDQIYHHDWLITDSKSWKRVNRKK